MTSRRFLQLITISSLLSTAPSFGFHDGGTASCGQCHVTHQSEDGETVYTSPDGEALLRGESPSDVCLSCHAEALGAVLGINPLAPPPERGGGNFTFLFEDNLNDSVAEPGVIPGEAGGHSIVAPGHGLVADSRHTFSPGGSYPSSDLGCTSCHDPHGNQEFRFLLDGRQFGSGGFVFRGPAPTAAGLQIEGPGAETRDLHTAYQWGMSRWCGNCHGLYHERGQASFQHPVNVAFASDERDRYNLYNGDEDPTGGSAATAYLPEVPFEDRSMTVTSQQGPAASSYVICSTCHRAHATSAPGAGRWDFAVELLQEDGVPSGSYPIPNPYPGPNQGSLCRKCHASGDVVDPFTSASGPRFEN